MTNELRFQTHSLFQSVTYEIAADSWSFSFADEIQISALGFWRLLIGEKIRYVSIDHGHQFGLPKPLDLIDEVTRQLTGKLLIEIKVSKGTADLILNMSDELRIEIYISSSGYESYDFSIQNKRIIGMGSGDIEIFEK